MVNIEIQYIDHDDEAIKFTKRWQGSSVVAIDTEFDRSRSFYAKPGLIQCAIGGHIAFVDPLNVSVESYESILTDKHSLKLIHACGEDLELLNRLCGEVPQPLFDTQLAATYVGYRHQMGYQGLVKEILGVDIPKHQTRSNWLQRPLSEEQLEYAALDVVYLEDIYDKLVVKLQAMDRFDWVVQDCHQLAVNAAVDIPVDAYYLHIGNAWQLKLHQLAVLRELCTWRETEVRRIDIPRSFLISDALLWELAKLMPHNKQKLSNISGFKPGIIRKYGDLILAKIDMACDLSDEKLPTIVSEPLSKAVPQLTKKLKAIIKVNAEKLDLPAEVLCRKKLLEELMVSYKEIVDADHEMKLPLGFQGWRKEVVLAPLMDVLDNNRRELKRL